MAGSREAHHYVPQMILRRFSAEPDQDNPLLWTLEFASGRIRRSSVRNEAAVTDYNRLDDSQGREPGLAERAFGEIEAAAGRASVWSNGHGSRRRRTRGCLLRSGPSRHR